MKAGFSTLCLQRLTPYFLCFFLFAPQASATSFVPTLTLPVLSLVSEIESPETKIEQSTPTPLKWEERLSFYGAGLGVAMAAVPLSLKAGTFLGTISNELYTSVLIPFSVFLVLPSAAVSVAQYYFGQKKNLQTRSWLWPFFAGMGIQIAGFAAGAAMGVNTHNLDEMVAFSFVQALILPTFTTLVFWPQQKALVPSSPQALGNATTPENRFNKILVSKSFAHLPLWATSF